MNCEMNSMGVKVMRDDVESYLTAYPKLRKWINECIMCHTKGYKPNMPKDLHPWGSAAAKNLRSYLKPLELNEDGLCESCSHILRKHS
jgi:hypothetical protein